MRRFLTLLFLVKLGLVFGQDFSYPSLEKKGKDIYSFIPNGWVLLDSAQGDLNHDHHKDLALIIQHKDRVPVINPDKDTVLTQPRILIILFYNPTTNHYQLEEQNNSFILNSNQSNMEDPYQSITIDNGELKINFHIFMTMGSWGRSNNSYKFRFQNPGFALIEADYNYVNRRSGETEDRQYNFLTKKVKVATGTIERDKQKVIWRTISLKELKTFKTFTQPFTWEVEKDFYL